MNEHDFLRKATPYLKMAVAYLVKALSILEGKAPAPTKPMPKIDEQEFLAFWESRTHGMHENGIGVIFNRTEALRFYRVYLNHKDSISKQVASEVVD